MSKTQRWVITAGLLILLVWVAAPIAARSGGWAFWGSLLLALPASLVLALVWASELEDFLSQSPGWKNWTARFPEEGKPLVKAVERGVKDLVKVAEWAGQFKEAFQRSESMEFQVGKGVVSFLVLFMLTVPGLHFLAMNHFFATVLGVVLVGTGGLVQARIWAPQVRQALAAETENVKMDAGSSCYGVAEALRQQGRFTEALAEVQRQLTTRPNDFLGLVLLAEIQAENLNDLAAAQRTLDDIVNAPGQSPPNIAYAFNQLATWHLKFNRDAVAARHALEKILNRFPQTPWAQAARQRISQLRAADAAGNTLTTVPPVIKAPATLSAVPANTVSLVDPVKATAELVKRLEDYPEDLAAREQLARLYADHYHRPDLAADQLDQLITFPGQPAGQVNRQLQMLIDLQLKQQDGLDLARQTLRQIMDQNPNTLAAELAQKQWERINHTRVSTQTPTSQDD